GGCSRWPVERPGRVTPPRQSACPTPRSTSSGRRGNDVPAKGANQRRIGGCAMAQVKGFEPNLSGQKPTDDMGNPVAVGVWGDSDIGVGVFGSTGPIPATATDIPVEIAGVEGHGLERPVVGGRCL